MENKMYYFLCNHWTECGIGYAFKKGWYQGQWYPKTFSSMYTIEKTMEAADTYPWVIPCLELDSYAYEQLQKHAPATFQKLQSYVQQGKVGIEGGSYGQPLGQDYGGESNIAHLVYGKQVIQQLFQYDLKAFMVEEQWFHPQLPQLLKKSGFPYASLQCQNSGQVKTPMQNIITWQGIDGSCIETIPVNDCMISCVKQYGDYSDVWKRLQRYKQPLLFQWAEVWVPGMDWGASFKPFEKAFLDIKEKGAISVTLQQYIEQVKENVRHDVVNIPYDDSNYGNDWYQSGGWGYDGDRILYESKECENWIKAYEAKRFYHGKGNDEERDDYWKRLMILQNHDVSVARGYRAVSEDGIQTDANSLFIRDLKLLKKALMNACEEDSSCNQVVSYLGMSTNKTFVLPKSSYHKVYVEDKQVPSSLQEDGLHVCLPIKAFKQTSFMLSNPTTFLKKATMETKFTYQNIEVSYMDGWKIKIKEKDSNSTVVYQAFSGSIGKRNEHDDHFHALSNAHHQFSFAFDGQVHCPDQCSNMYVSYDGIEEDDLYIVMKLSCSLLTLHTTDTPVAFANCSVALNKVTMEITCSSYLYCGVYLNMDAYATFTYDFEGDVFRNYPFGEEQTTLDAFYALDYVRVSNADKSFVIMNYGNQRILKKDQQLRFKISKGKMFEDYKFKFKLSFTGKDEIEAMEFLQNEQLMPLSVPNETIMRWDARELFCSSVQYVQGKRAIRLFNYSNHVVTSRMTLPQGIKTLIKCDFHLHAIEEVALQKEGEKTYSMLVFQPHEIVYLMLCEEN